MKRTFVSIAIASGLAGCQLLSPSTQQARAQLARSYPQLPVQDVRQSPVKGLLEVYTEGQIVYYAPRENALFFGEMLSPDGTSASRTRYSAWLGERAAMLDLSQSITIGTGPTELIAFVDPDCGHCRAAASWLDRRNYAQLKVHFFFLPMDPAGDAYRRALQFACAPEALRREALRQTFGLTAPGGDSLHCADGERRLAAQSEIVRNLGVVETPVFVAKGQTVKGFTPDRLEALLFPAVPSLAQGVSP